MPFRFGKGAGGVVEGLLIHLSLIWAKYISLARQTLSHEVKTVKILLNLVWSLSKLN